MVRRHDPEVVDDRVVDDILRAMAETPLDVSLDAAVADVPALLPVQDAAPAQDETGEDWQPPDENEQPPLASLGLLTDLATGRKDAAEVASAAGITVEALQDQVAFTLAEVAPDEITRVIGLQALQQQLKSGALYGAVISALARDLVGGRLTPAHKLEMAKVLARMGRVEPREEKNQAMGGAFVLNINVGAGQPPVVIEAQPPVVEDA